MAGTTPVGEFLASLPYQVGHQLDDQHVVAAALAADGPVAPIAAIQWDTHPLPVTVTSPKASPQP